MLQDGKMLASMLGCKANLKGVFYLCGPTWPVPDVFEAIVGALGEYDGMERSLAEQYIEDLEEEHYVLEVYWILSLLCLFVPTCLLLYIDEVLQACKFVDYDN
jgi:sulfite reductase (NADPH) flavoprotein alpha-component